MSFDTSAIKYHKSWLADYFHRFPHVDFTFEETSSTFDPESGSYREVLAFWAGIPLLCCVVIWLVLLIFFCVRCCGKTDRKQSKTLCSRFCAAVFLLCGCGTLAVAFYGNAEFHTGADNFIHSVEETNKTIENAQKLLRSLDRIANNTENRGLPALSKAVSFIPNVTVHTQIGQYIQQIVTSINTVRTDFVSMRQDAASVNTEELTDTTKDAEYYRWMLTILVYCVYIVIFFVSFAGLLKKSKCMLILVAVLSTTFALAIWAATSFYMILAIAGGDLCVDPNSFVLSQVNGTVKQDVLQAFIECDDSSQPYQGLILDAQTAVTQAITALNATVNVSTPFNISDKLSGPVSLVRNDLKFVFGNLSTLTTQIGSCDIIHNEYITSVRAVCHSALEGVGYMLLFSALVGLFSVLLVFCSALAWPHLGRRRMRRDRVYAPVDASDPFLPDPPPYEHNYGSIGSSDVVVARHQSGAVNIHEEDRPNLNMGPEGESPPPAYQPGHFMQQYYNLAPTPTSIVQSSQTTT